MVRFKVRGPGAVWKNWKANTCALKRLLTCVRAHSFNCRLAPAVCVIIAVPRAIIYVSHVTVTIFITTKCTTHSPGEVDQALTTRFIQWYSSHVLSSTSKSQSNSYSNLLWHLIEDNIASKMLRCYSWVEHFVHSEHTFDSKPQSTSSRKVV